MADLNPDAFPTLTESEMRTIGATHGVECRTYHDGDIVFRAGDADIDFFVVESGQIEILNPTNDNAHITMHEANTFVGDIDLITRRPVIVTAIARGETRVLVVPGDHFRHLLNTIPPLSEKLITAFTARRKMLQKAGILGMKVIGPSRDRDTMLAREFLHKNFVPMTWYDSDSEDGRRELAAMGLSDATDFPIVRCPIGRITRRPRLAQLARCAGVQWECPDKIYDLAVIGGGPAGMTAAVYAASEALCTIVLDRMGPGGQAAGSSMIENFIGFPSGLSGADLATRGVLQMLKFGAILTAPVEVQMIGGCDDAGVYYLQLDDGTAIRARSILIATGVKWRRLEATQADKFERAGVYYAATAVEQRICKGADLVVVGAGNSAGQAAMFLSECANKVYMLIRGSGLGAGMSDYLKTRIEQNSKIEVRSGTEITDVLGDDRVSGVATIHKATGRRDRIDCTGVFCFIGAEAPTGWLPPEIALDDKGFILTGIDAQRSGKWPLDREPCTLETTLPGVLAAGDVRSGSTKRVGFAVGDGSMAITCVHKLRAIAAAKAAAEKQPALATV